MQGNKRIQTLPSTEFQAATNTDMEVLAAMREPAYRARHKQAMQAWILEGANCKPNSRLLQPAS